MSLATRVAALATSVAQKISEKLPAPVNAITGNVEASGTFTVTEFRAHRAGGIAHLTIAASGTVETGFRTVALLAGKWRPLTTAYGQARVDGEATLSTVVINPDGYVQVRANQEGQTLRISIAMPVLG